MFWYYIHNLATCDEFNIHQIYNSITEELLDEFYNYDGLGKYADWKFFINQENWEV